VLTLQSGMPFDIKDTRNQPNTRPNLVGPLHQLNGVANTPANKLWFDTSAFVDPPLSANGVYVAPGTTPRDPFNGPARKFLDLTIAKNFTITERVNAQFRSAFYNITNSPQFGTPTGDFNDGNFGTVKSIVLGSERQIEFALRFSF